MRSEKVGGGARYKNVVERVKTEEPINFKYKEGSKVYYSVKSHLTN